MYKEYRRTKTIIDIITVSYFNISKECLIFVFVRVIKAKGGIRGIKYRAWTPLITVSPTGVKDAYNAVQIKTIIPKTKTTLNNLIILSFLDILFLYESVKITNNKTQTNKKYKLSS